MEGVAREIFPQLRWRHRRRLSHVWLSPCCGWLVDSGLWRAFCWVPWVSFYQRGGVDFSFVGLSDRSAGVWAWMGLHPCSR